MRNSVILIDRIEKDIRAGSEAIAKAALLTASAAILPLVRLDFLVF